MELELEIDHLGRELPVKPFNLQVPLQTRLNFLRVFGTEQEENIQDDCPHKSFDSRSDCETCGLRCEHWDQEDGHCLFCGDAMVLENERKKV